MRPVPFGTSPTIFPSGAKFSVLFLNSGDLLTKNALKIIYNKFSKNKNIDFVFGTVKRHYSNISITKSGYNPLKLNFNFDFATSHSSGFFIKLISSKKVGNFNTKTGGLII